MRGHFYLRFQITDALNKCRFLRPIREGFGLQNTDLDLSEDEMPNPGGGTSTSFVRGCVATGLEN